MRTAVSISISINSFLRLKLRFTRSLVGLCRSLVRVDRFIEGFYRFSLALCMFVVCLFGYLVSFYKRSLCFNTFLIDFALDFTDFPVCVECAEII